MFNKRHKEFLKSARRVFNTEDGKMVLSNLKIDYVNRSAVGLTTEETYYNIGKQDLIQELVRLVEDETDLDNLATQVMNGERAYE